MTDSNRPDVGGTCLVQEWLQDQNSTHELTHMLCEMQNVQDLLIRECARRLCQPLNAYLSNLPQSSIEEKRNMCRWLNATLGGLRMGIVCPKTGRLGVLAVDEGHDSERGRFQIRVADQSPYVRHTTTSMVHLSKLRFEVRVPEHRGRRLEGNQR